MTSLRVRRNWGFITRRTPRPAESQAATEQTAAPTLNFSRPGRTPSLAATPAPAAPLNFTRPGASPAGTPLTIGTAPAGTPTPRATRPVAGPTASVPTLDTAAMTLAHEEPVVRLSRLQSAIGALRIDGAGDIGWQSADGQQGISRAGTNLRGGPTHANRPLIERTGMQQVLVNLRHVNDLRRLAITAADTAVTITTAGGSAITIPGTAYIHVVGGALELRHELGATVTDFGFTG